VQRGHVVDFVLPHSTRRMVCVEQGLACEEWLSEQAAYDMTWQKRSLVNRTCPTTQSTDHTAQEQLQRIYSDPGDISGWKLTLDGPRSDLSISRYRESLDSLRSA